MYKLCQLPKGGGSFSKSCDDAITQLRKMSKNLHKSLLNKERRGKIALIVFFITKALTSCSVQQTTEVLKK